MLYAQEREHIVYFTFSLNFDDNFYTVQNMHDCILLIYSFLNRKKEVVIFRDSISEIHLEKGCHFKLTEDFIYLNPSIRKKLKKQLTMNSNVSFLSLYKSINSIVNT